MIFTIKWCDFTKLFHATLIVNFLVLNGWKKTEFTIISLELRSSEKVILESVFESFIFCYLYLSIAWLKVETHFLPKIDLETVWPDS